MFRTCVCSWLALFLLKPAPSSVQAGGLLSPYAPAELDSLYRRDARPLSGSGGACEEDIADGYTWPAGTAAGEVVNGTCFQGAAQATRECGEDCSWGDVVCSVSTPLMDIRKYIGIVSADLLMQQYRNVTRMPGKAVEPMADAVLLLELLDSALEEAGASTPLATEFQEDCVESISNLLNTSYREASRVFTEEERRLSGSSLLLLAERLGLQGGNELAVFADNMEMRVSIVDPSQQMGPYTTTTSTSNSISLLPHFFSAISQFPTVSVLTLQMRNLSYFLPDQLPNATEQQLVSPVLSAAVQCGESECSLDNLPAPVVISFQHSQQLAATLRADSSVGTVCVFWEFVRREEQALYSGYWSTFGCNKTVQSSPAQTVCECDHLTPFALLLSPVTIEVADTIVLGVGGYVCVGISLVAMLVTIATYTCFRSLWSMRNYIHVHLCVNLSIAQLVFVVGVTPVGDSGVSAGCRAVAVLLHYFFLVSFMWMLMEGVVLYVALVRVFVKHQLRYIIAFTLTSYGLPLVYLIMCILIGFLNWEEEAWGYGYQQACWLRAETHFKWTFIAPVIAIILVNVVILCCVLVIVCQRYSRKSEEDKTSLKSATHWLKVCSSLVAVLTITWVIGVVMLTRALLPLVYVYTIFVALQGVLIFTLLVPLSRAVRTSFLKCCRGVIMNSKLQGTYRVAEGKPSPVQTSKKSAEAFCELHSNPVAAKYIVTEDESSHSLGTKAACNPSDVSLWRVAQRVSCSLDNLEELDELEQINSTAL